MAGQTKYEREMRRLLRTNSFLVEPAAPEFLGRLEALADRALAKRTVEGNLAAILVYHQLVEEMLRLLLRDCELYLQLSAFPAEIRFPIRRKQTFGNLHRTLSESVEFPLKDRILARAARLNIVRIGIVHGLVQAESLAGLRKRVLQARRLYEGIYLLFDEAHDEFRVGFKDLRKDKFDIFSIRKSKPARPYKRKAGENG